MQIWEVNCEQGKEHHNYCRPRKVLYTAEGEQDALKQFLNEFFPDASTLKIANIAPLIHIRRQEVFPS